jgi:hypothetical protein
MKRPYLHLTPKNELKPMCVYAVKCFFDLKMILGHKRIVRHTKLKSGLMLDYYKD